MWTRNTRIPLARAESVFSVPPPSGAEKQERRPVLRDSAGVEGIFPVIE